MTDWVSHQHLNRRQRFFAETLVTHGFYVALKAAGYKQKQGYRLLNDYRIKRYILSLIKEAMGEISLTLGELIKKRFELANDKATPEKLRDDIYKDLIQMAMDAGKEVEKLGSFKALKPSKDIMDASFEESKDERKEGNGEIKLHKTKVYKEGRAEAG